MTELQLNTKILKAYLASLNDPVSAGVRIGEYDEKHWLCTLDGTFAYIFPKALLHLDLSEWGTRAGLSCKYFHPERTTQTELVFTGECIALPVVGRNKTGLVRVYKFKETENSPPKRVYVADEKFKNFGDPVRLTAHDQTDAVYLYDCADSDTPCGFIMPIRPRTVEEFQRKGVGG